MITPNELEALLKQHRWIIARGMSGKQAVYAAKQRQGKTVVTRYIGTANRLNHLTEEDIVAKLNRSPKNASHLAKIESQTRRAASKHKSPLAVPIKTQMGQIGQTEGQ